MPEGVKLFPVQNTIFYSFKRYAEGTLLIGFLILKKFPGNTPVLLFPELLSGRECLVDLFSYGKIRELGVYDWVDLGEIRFPVRHT